MLIPNNNDDDDDDVCLSVSLSVSLAGTTATPTDDAHFFLLYTTFFYFSIRSSLFSRAAAAKRLTRVRGWWAPTGGIEKKRDCTVGVSETQFSLSGFTLLFILFHPTTKTPLSDTRLSLNDHRPSGPQQKKGRTHKLCQWQYVRPEQPLPFFECET